MNITSNSYFVCPISQPDEAIQWDIYDTNNIIDPSLVYFGKVLQKLSKTIKTSNLIFYLTWSVQRLPSYGENVVVILLGDELCRIPQYIYKVGIVFKASTTCPILGCNPLLDICHKNILNLMQFLRIWIIRLPGWIKFKFYNWLNMNSKKIYNIPLGYYKQSDIAIKNIQTRQYDIFFAGNYRFTHKSKFSLKHWLQNPKHISRDEMIFNLEKIKQKYSEFNIELAITSDFGKEASSFRDKRSYSERLMDTKICLAPRGSMFETFRFFEGLRYGCIVIAEALPPSWFYQDAPIIKINNWKELEQLLVDLLPNQELLQKMQKDSLKFWRNKCSEEVIAKYIAETIDLKFQNNYICLVNV